MVCNDKYRKRVKFVLLTCSWLTHLNGHFKLLSFSVSRSLAVYTYTCTAQTMHSHTFIDVFTLSRRLKWHSTSIQILYVCTLSVWVLRESTQTHTHTNTNISVENGNRICAFNLVQSFFVDFTLSLSHSYFLTPSFSFSFALSLPLSLAYFIFPLPNPI